MHAAYNVALIGAGGIARAHRQAANASEGVVKVTAAVDVREDAPAAGLLPVYPTLESLLASEHKPDAIVLCTPPSVRAEVIEPALAAGLGVLTEKPVARSHAEAEALLKIVEEHDAGDRCFVGYCHRFTPAIVEMRRRLLAGDLGTPIRFENTFACWHPGMQTGWMSDPATSGGGSFLDTGCHSIDLFRFVTGEHEAGSRVIGSRLHFEWDGRGDSNATVLLGGSGGIAGVLQSGWQEPERFVVSVVGSKGLLSYDYMQPETLRFQPSAEEFGPAEDLWIETHDVRFVRQLEAFARRCQGESPLAGDEHLCTLREAVQVARLADDATSMAS